MTAAFALAGYSAEDLAQDNAENGIGGGSGTSKPNFVIPLEYRLEEGSLVVKVPVGQVKESGQYQIRSLELLNMFGAADQLTDGYMLVPDGSGSLIRLNNGKVKEEQYVQRVYGPDPNDNSYRRGQVSQNARMPVFGMKAGMARGSLSLRRAMPSRVSPLTSAAKEFLQFHSQQLFPAGRG